MIKVDVRVVSASNKILEEAVRQGRFRSDLYYRLLVMKIRLPALRERSGDIPILASHFLDLCIDPRRKETLRLHPCGDQSNGAIRLAGKRARVGARGHTRGRAQ